MTESAEQLESLGRAAITIDQCLARAVSMIDGLFGADYAKKNPGLTSTIAVSIATEYQAVSRDTILDRLAVALEGLG